MILKSYTILENYYRYKINKTTFYLFVLLSMLIVSKLFSQNNTLKSFNYSEDLKWENPEWENPEIFGINKEKPRSTKLNFTKVYSF